MCIRSQVIFEIKDADDDEKKESRSRKGMNEILLL